VNIVAVIIIIGFIIAVFSVVRWQVSHIQDEIRKQQSELIHTSNLIALGEMAGGIAHEINNPLQSLSLHTESLKRQILSMEKPPEKMKNQLEVIEKMIYRIARIIKGLKDLTRNDFQEPLTVFRIGDAIDDVILVSSQRF